MTQDTETEKGEINENKIKSDRQKTAKPQMLDVEYGYMNTIKSPRLLHAWLSWDVWEGQKVKDCETSCSPSVQAFQLGRAFLIEIHTQKGPLSSENFQQPTGY